MTWAFHLQNNKLEISEKIFSNIENDKYLQSYQIKFQGHSCDLSNAMFSLKTIWKLLAIPLNGLINDKLFNERIAGIYKSL